MGLRAFLLAVGAAGVALASARNSSAMGAIATAPTSTTAASEVRAAVASDGTRTSQWVSLGVHGDGAAFAWVLPVKPGTYVDLASDAWLESLEDATAPRLLPPTAKPPLSCTATLGIELDGDPSHTATVAPDAVIAAADAATLNGALAQWGVALPSDLAPLVEAAGASGDSFLALHFPAGGADVRTKTVRLVAEGAPSLSLSWTRGPGTVPVTAYVLTSGPMALGGAPLLLADPTHLLWNPGGSTTYVGVTGSLLASNPGAWLLDTTGHAPLFSGDVLGVGDAAVPSLAHGYFTRSSLYGDAGLDAASCEQGAVAWAASATSVAVACPRASLGRVGSAAGDPGCTESAGANEVPPDAFRCGGAADDLALALSGLAPGHTWVSRVRTATLPDTFGADAVVETIEGFGVATGPGILCSGWGGECAGQGSPTGGPPTGPTGSSSGTTPGTGTDDTSGSDPGTAAVAVAGAAADASDGCGGDSSDSGGGCGGDSSSSSDSSSSNSGGCSSSDSSSSSSSGDGCSGDSGSSNCSVTGGRASGSRGRSPVSRFGLALVALALVARRRRNARES